MKASTTAHFRLDSSTVGELRAAVAAMGGLPDDAPFTVLIPIEFKMGQNGNRVAAINVGDATSTKPAERRVPKDSHQA